MMHSDQSFRGIPGQPCSTVGTGPTYKKRYEKPELKWQYIKNKDFNS